MAYIALDILTQECVGPFDTEDQALAFAMEASDFLGDQGLAFDIHTIYEPTEWALNNTSTSVEEVEDGSNQEGSSAVLSTTG